MSHSLLPTLTSCNSCAFVSYRLNWRPWLISIRSCSKSGSCSRPSPLFAAQSDTHHLWRGLCRYCCHFCFFQPALRLQRTTRPMRPRLRRPARLLNRPRQQSRRLLRQVSPVSAMAVWSCRRQHTPRSPMRLTNLHPDKPRFRPALPLNHYPRQRRIHTQVYQSPI